MNKYQRKEILESLVKSSIIKSLPSDQQPVKKSHGGGYYFRRDKIGADIFADGDIHCIDRYSPQESTDKSIYCIDRNSKDKSITIISGHRDYQVLEEYLDKSIIRLLESVDMELFMKEESND